MHPLLRILLCLGIVCAASRAISAELNESFDAPRLDTAVWNACQLSGAPLTFEELTEADGEIRRVLRNVVNETTGNEESCFETKVSRDAMSSTADPTATAATLDVEGSGGLGPSLIDPSPLEALDVAECPKGGDKQRNELRLQLRDDLVHEHDDPHWYSITFRADGNIPSCGSARWILAQWKQEFGVPAGGGDASPFLAQRFDNGVLHVTVQADDCRCVVAQAKGDPDMMIAALTAKAADPLTLEAIDPIKCILTNLPDGAAEQECKPPGLKVMTLGGDPPPQLPDPKQGWVQMTYLVRGGFDGNGRIDVYSGDAFVVRVLGRFGYEIADPGHVKFKFGHYRNQIPKSTSMSVDSLCLSEDSQICAPDIETTP